MSVSGFVEEARAAHGEHRYDATYRALCAAGEQGPLAPEDLRLLADSVSPAISVGVQRARCIRHPRRNGI